MSAYKTAIIRLGETEYTRLREAEERLRLLELNQVDQKKDNSYDASLLNKISNQNKARNREFQNALVGLDQEVRSIEKNTSQWVQIQLKQVEVQLNHAQNEQYRRTDQILNALIDQFNKALDQHSHQINQQINQQESRLISIESRIDLYRNEARKWLEAANRLLEYILSHYTPDAQVSNAITLEDQRLGIAIDQFNQGMVEFACSTGLQTYADLSQIRAQLESAEILRSIHQQRMIVLASQVRDRIEKQMTVHAMDVDGNELSDPVNVNFWTEGAYADLVEELNKLLKIISTHPGMIESDIEQCSLNLKEIENRSIELVTQARLGVLSSQLRFNIAQIVVQALETQGFNLEEARFNRSDYREAFTATTRNLSGNEVVVTIDPTNNLEEGGKLHIASTDGSIITEHELLQRNREIFEAIHNAGLDVSQIQVNSAPPTATTIKQTPVQPKEHKKQITDVEKIKNGRR